MEKSSNLPSFSDYLKEQYGLSGTPKRTEPELRAKAFAIGELVKEERRLAHFTQEQLADKTGAKKSFISRIENGHSNIQLSTLFQLIEGGLGKKLNFPIS